MTTKEHYEQHLSHFYSWMAGDFDSKAAEQKAFFQLNNINPKSSRIVLDLGAGHGLQSVPLAQLGFSVKAIDFSPVLLKELNSRKGKLDIETIEADLTDLGRFSGLNPELVVCMGDTISHLQSREQLATLTVALYNLLAPGGKLVYSFRDYSHALEDTQRFIPVKGDEARIHTCFLEYFEDTVRVTDLVHEKENGVWRQKVSSYLKLRLQPDIVKSTILKSGFVLAKEEMINRMVYLVAAKAAI